MRLAGKVAIVTGGAQGIGRAFSERFAKEGAAVAILDLSRADQAKEVESAITKAGGKAVAMKADVTDEDGMRAVADEVAKRFGGIDILINNAGIFQDFAWTDDSIDYAKQVFEVNTWGILRCGRAVLPHMKKRGGGSIINMASTAAFPRFQPSLAGILRDNFSHDAYGLSKSTVVYLTKSMARTAGRFNVRVNAIAPGPVLSEAMVNRTDLELMLSDKCIKRAQTPAEIVGTAVHLASDDAIMMTGQTLVVDGGGVHLG